MFTLPITVRNIDYRYGVSRISLASAYVRTVLSVYKPVTAETEQAYIATYTESCFGLLNRNRSTVSRDVGNSDQS